MAFVKKTWKDRIAEFPTRRRLTKEDNTSELVTVAREEGTLSQEGDAFSAENMNDLENRIDAEFTAVNGKLDQSMFTKVSTKFGNTAGLIKVCDYPSGYTADNTCIIGFRFKYSVSSDWYTYMPYFTNSGTITVNMQLKSDGIYVYLAGSEVNSFLGKDLELYLVK